MSVIANTRTATAAIPATATGLNGVAGDKAAAFLQLLSLMTSLTKESRSGNWVNIHNKTIRKYVGREYATTVGNLEKKGIIEVNRRYSTGLEGKAPFTMSYRLARAHRHGRQVLHSIRSTWAVNRALTTYEPDPENLREGGMHYWSRFDQFRIDADAASQDPALQNHWHQGAIARFANQREFATRCQYGRYHCLVTQMPRKSRKYISTVDNDKLAVVDVSACQPLLLGYLVASDWQKTRAESRGKQQPSYDAQSWRWDVPVDVRKWVELAEGREIYNYLRDRVRELPSAIVNLNALNLNALNRAPHGRPIDLKSISEHSFKKACLVMLFESNESMLLNPLYKIVQVHFPTIAKLLVESKRQRHQVLACILQRLESELMIDRLGCELKSLYPNEPVQPIHDALLVREQFAETAESLIKGQFRLLGLSPQVKHEAL